MKIAFKVIVMLLLPAIATAGMVHGYTRKDGTYVAPYYRSAPQSHYNPTVSAPSITIPGLKKDNHSRIKRSSAEKHAFEKVHPCPSTGKSSGACPGYIVDHIVPLKRGGADDPSNMQWQTDEEAKVKDKVE